MIPDGWLAPAKLNLCLRIVGRRADGYHELQTAFQFLDVADRLYFNIRQDGLITRTIELPGVALEEDLCIRAAKALQHEAGIPSGVDITLEKHLPMGGGLGGGSSDAATVLVALNQLWHCGFDTQRLAAIGLTLGADVPVFVHGHAAWGEGIGEQLTPLNLPESWYVVLVPPCHVSTAAIFAAPELTRNSLRIKIGDFLAGESTNDCLPLVCAKYPEVAQAIDWLSGYGLARLTGTGACVFAAFSSPAEAAAVCLKAPARMSPFVAKGKNQSPLLAQLLR